MKTIVIIFWVFTFVVFYTYLGYGILLYCLVKIKEWWRKPVKEKAPEAELLPSVTLFIAAYNEQDVVAAKMANSLALDYPADKFTILWVMDGSTDRSVEMIELYMEQNNQVAGKPRIALTHQEQRGGKAAAFNRGIAFVDTPLVIFTDANTMLNKEAVKEIVAAFEDKKIGCVAGEKRVTPDDGWVADAASTEGLYWKYESCLKALDTRLYSAVGAAGELFAIRTELFESLPADTLLDDFMLSMKIAQRGYKIAYCSTAYAVEGTSANIMEEGKRKTRIAAGGLQSVWRLRSLLNIFKYRTLSFQYVSHRVLRWCVTPFCLLALLPLNILLVVERAGWIYDVSLVAQLLFYVAGLAGALLSKYGKKNKILYVTYYFLFMNYNVFKGGVYLTKKRGIGVWEKAKRA